MTSESSRFESLAELRSYIGDCQRCPLATTRNLLVFGIGKSDADVMFIGEAPGRNEDLKGEPFVGAAGQLLDELLGSVGLSRADVYIANILKCRPPNNRDPEAQEIETCTPFLREQIRLVQPRVIVTLGKFATQFMLRTDAGITRLRGRRHEIDGRAVLPIFHPAAALYDQTKRQTLQDDFKRLRALLDREMTEAATSSSDASGSDVLSDRVEELPAVNASDGWDESEDDARDFGGASSEPVQETLF